MGASRPISLLSANWFPCGGVDGGLDIQERRTSKSVVELPAKSQASQPWAGWSNVVALGQLTSGYTQPACHGFISCTYPSSSILTCLISLALQARVTSFTGI